MMTVLRKGVSVCVILDPVWKGLIELRVLSYGMVTGSTCSLPFSRVCWENQPDASDFDTFAF